jgi:hypothetical protein
MAQHNDPLTMAMDVSPLHYVIGSQTVSHSVLDDKAGVSYIYHADTDVSSSLLG